MFAQLSPGKLKRKFLDRDDLWGGLSCVIQKVVMVAKKMAEHSQEVILNLCVIEVFPAALNAAKMDLLAA